MQPSPTSAFAPPTGGATGRQHMSTNIRADAAAPTVTTSVASVHRWLQRLFVSDDIKLPLFLVATLVVFLSSYFLREVCIPFTIAMLLTYLLRPAVVVCEETLSYMLTCCNARCCVTAHTRMAACWAKISCCSWARSSRSKAKEEEGKAAEKKGLLKSPPDTPGSPNSIPLPEPEGGLSFVRLFAVVVATLLMVGVLALIVLVCADSIQSFQEQHWDTFSKQFDVVMRRLVTWIKTNLHFDASSLLTMFDTLQKEFSSSSTLMSIANAILVVVVTLLFMMFLLLDKRFDNVGPIITTHLSAKRSRLEARVDVMWATIDAAIHRYIIVKTLLSAGMGLMVYITLGPILHVKLAHLFGVLTFILNFIPNVGAVVAALLPLPVILLDPELSSVAQAFAIVLPLAIHFIIGNFVEPFVLGPLLSLHPVIVLLSLGFWYIIWGVAGAILAVPMTSVIAIALKQTGHTYAHFIVGILEEFRIDLHLLKVSWGGGKGDEGGEGGGLPLAPHRRNSDTSSSGDDDDDDEDAFGDLVSADPGVPGRVDITLSCAGEGRGGEGRGEGLRQRPNTRPGGTHGAMAPTMAVGRTPVPGSTAFQTPSMPTGHSTTQSIVLGRTDNGANSSVATATDAEPPV